LPCYEKKPQSCADTFHSERDRQHTCHKRNQRPRKTAASALGWVPADVYRAAFTWWLDCFAAAGKREPSDIERAAALASIKLAHGRIAEALGTYEAKGRK
jgi:hypothetical protein